MGSSSTKGSMTVATAHLDEPLGAITANVDITIHELFIKVPLKLAVPVSLDPPIRQGDWKITYAEKTSQSADGFGVKAEGQIDIVDGKGEEVACVALTQDKE